MMQVVGPITRECKACCGAGVQTRNDGIRIECPSCDGQGQKQMEFNAPSQPIFLEPRTGDPPPWTITCAGTGPEYTQLQVAASDLVTAIHCYAHYT